MEARAAKLEEESEALRAQNALMKEALKNIESGECQHEPKHSDYDGLMCDSQYARDALSRVKEGK